MIHKITAVHGLGFPTESENSGVAMHTTLDEHAEIVRILNLRFHKVTEIQCSNLVIDHIRCGIGGWIVTCNVDILRRFSLDTGFRNVASEATVFVADGMPLIWASRLQGTPLPERVAGSNLIKTLSAAAAAADKSVFLLGGDPGTADAAAAELTNFFPNLRVAGTLCPVVGFESSDSAMREIILKISIARPSVVFVALGSPKQEMLISQLRGLLPESWWIGVGISFSFLSGNVSRAPKWMQRSGLEWLHRLWQEPRRLARRYLVDGIPFATYLLANSALVRFRRRSSDTEAGTCL